MLHIKGGFFMQSVVKQKTRAAFPEEYANPFSAAYWREAAAQLTDIRIICIAAILIAVRVALKEVKIPIGENLNITVGFFVNALGAMIFGPVVAVVAAAASDTLGCALAGFADYFFPFIFVEIAGSLVFALFLWRSRLTETRIILSRFFVSLVCNFIMNPLILNLQYSLLNNGKFYEFFTLPRIIKNLALFPAEAFLLVLFLGVMTPALLKLKLVPKNQKELVMTRSNYILLGGLFIVAAVFVLLYVFVYLPNK